MLTAPPPANGNGAVLIGESPEGKRMGLVRLKRGHQALLPAGCGYRFTASTTPLGDFTPPMLACTSQLPSGIELGTWIAT